jgi:WD40 repeat protein
MNPDTGSIEVSRDLTDDLREIKPTRRRGSFTIGTIAFADHGRRLLAIDDFGFAGVVVLDAATLEVLRVIDPEVPSDAKFFGLGDSRLFALSYDDTKVKVFDSESGQIVQEFSVPQGPIASIEVVGPNQTLLVSSERGAIYTWDDSFTQTATLLGNEGGLDSPTRYLADGSILTCAYNSEVRTWREPTATSDLARHSQPGNSLGIGAVGVDDSAQRVSSRSSRSRAEVFDLASGSSLFRAPLEGRGMAPPALSPNGKLIALFDSRGALSVWDVGSGELKHTIPVDGPVTSHVVFSPDNRFIVADQFQAGPVVVDVVTGGIIFQCDTNGASIVRKIVFSPDSSTFMLYYLGSEAELWDVSKREIRATLDNEAMTSAMAFSPSGKELAVGTRQGGIRMYDVRSGDLLNVLDFHESPIASIAYEREGSSLVAGASNGSAVVWDLQQNAVRLRVAGHDAPVSSVAISRDQSRVFTSSSDGTTRAWDGTSGELLLTMNSGLGSTALVSQGSETDPLVAANAESILVYDPIPYRIRYAERLANARGEDGSAIVQAWLEAVKQGTEDDFVVPLN